MSVLLSAVVAVGPCYSYADPNSNNNVAYSYQTDYSSTEVQYEPSQTQYSYTDPESGKTYDVEVNIFPVYSDEDVQNAHEWFQDYKSQFEVLTDKVPLTVIQEEGQPDFEYIHEDFVTNYELVDKIELKAGMMGRLQNWISDTKEKFSQKVDRLVEAGNKPIAKKEGPGLREKTANLMINHPWKFRGGLAFLRFSGVSTASVFAAATLSGLPLGPALAVSLGWYGLFTFSVQMGSDYYSWIINNLSISAAVHALPKLFKRDGSFKKTYVKKLIRNQKNVPLNIFDKLMVFKFTEIPVLGVGVFLYGLLLNEPLYASNADAIVSILKGTAMASVAQGILDVATSSKDKVIEKDILRKIRDKKGDPSDLVVDLQMNKLSSAAKFFLVGILANFAVLLHQAATSSAGSTEFVHLSGAFVALLGLVGAWETIDAYKNETPAMRKLYDGLTYPYRKFKKTCSDLFSPDPNAVRFN